MSDKVVLVGSERWEPIPTLALAGLFLDWLEIRRSDPIFMNSANALDPAIADAYPFGRFGRNEIPLAQKRPDAPACQPDTHLEKKLVCHSRLSKVQRKREAAKQRNRE